MESREIRIGNIIRQLEQSFTGASGVPILVREPKKIEITIDNIFVISREIHNYEPIPLTEDWLIKLGWGKSDDHEYANNVSFAPYVFLYDYHFKRLEVQDDKDDITFKNIVYVHQLQNLIFSITGTELQIKQPEKV